VTASEPQCCGCRRPMDHHPGFTHWQAGTGTPGGRLGSWLTEHGKPEAGPAGKARIKARARAQSLPEALPGVLNDETRSRRVLVRHAAGGIRVTDSDSLDSGDHDDHWPRSTRTRIMIDLPGLIGINGRRIGTAFKVGLERPPAGAAACQRLQALPGPT
jgi:hypothetical protein